MKKLLIILIGLAVLSGCRTKQKYTERGRYKETIDTELKSETVKTSKKTAEIKKVETSEVLELTKNSILKLTQADPDKSITVTDHTGKSITIHGANAEIHNSETNKKETDSTGTKENLFEEIGENTNLEHNQTSEVDESFRNSNAKVKAPPTILMIGIGFAFCIGALFLANKYL
ncbi:hypothetical protein [Aegicerativicinus sediminis]|uniref:hypothetical protein n=1 Tax=Aegicerativicinus sediminis TaxID=2893202 RepID=UPI001E315640|nr:hypothetical protein [Aegicerativicinus sediminis]